MTLREFIAEAEKMNDTVKDKEVVIRAENGLLFEPKIKLIMGDAMSFDYSDAEKVIISYE